MTDPDLVAPDLRLVSTGATETELAAVTAVVSGALDELSAQLELESGSRRSAWQRSQRSVRATLTPGAGAWRSFSG